MTQFRLGMGRNRLAEVSKALETSRGASTGGGNRAASVANAMNRTGGRDTGEGNRMREVETDLTRLYGSHRFATNPTLGPKSSGGEVAYATNPTLDTRLAPKKNGTDEVRRLTELEDRWILKTGAHADAPWDIRMARAERNRGPWG